MAGRGLPDRLTQIWVDVAGGTYGSGLLLNGGLILTARHVIAPRAPLPDTFSISVRVGAPAKADWQAAELIWPERAALLDGPDVALLRLIDVPVAPVSPWTPLIGLPSDDEDSDQLGELHVTAVGFPSFATATARDKRRETYQLRGVAQPFAGLVSGTLQIDRPHVIAGDGSAQPDSSLNWAGFSGAAILTGNRYLVGVVTDVTPQSYYAFRGVRIEELFDDPTFAAAFGTAATRSTQPANVEIPSLDQFVYLVDRENQEGDFIDVHDTGRPAFVCFVPSVDDQHLPEELLDRFSQKTLPDRLNWPSGTTSFQWIAWPPDHLPAPAALNRLRREIWNRLGKTGAAPEEPQQFRTLFLSASQPRFFCSDLRPYELTESLGTIVAEWSRFLTSSAPADGRPIVHVVLVKASWNALRLWRDAIDARDAGAAPECAIAEVTELERCARLHIKRWFSESLRVKFPGQTRVLEDIESLLTADPEFAEFFVQRLKVKVKRSLDEARRG
jgi:hypothetical protein